MSDQTGIQSDNTRELDEFTIGEFTITIQANFPAFKRSRALRVNACIDGNDGSGGGPKLGYTTDLVKDFDSDKEIIKEN